VVAFDLETPIDQPPQPLRCFLRATEGEDMRRHQLPTSTRLRGPGERKQVLLGCGGQV
jgi:hypothetical protein